MTEPSKPESSKFGKLIAWIIIPLICPLLVWWLTRAGGLFNPEPPTPTPMPTAPHAPPIQIDFEAELFAEQVMIITVKSGESVTLSMRDLWDAPIGTPGDCMNSFVAFSWIVREPYPEGGEDLELRNIIPMNNGRTQPLANGSTGFGNIGLCDELTLHNTSLEDYRVEIRYASGRTSY